MLHSQPCCVSAISPPERPSSHFRPRYLGVAVVRRPENLKIITMLALSFASASSFVAQPLGATRCVGMRAPVTPQMGLFDGFAKAFENDDTLGKAGPAGLSKEATKRTVTWVGPKGQKKTAVCVPGQSLRDVARASGVPIVYDCSEGTCKTCEAKVGNGRAKICVAKMPNKVRAAGTRSKLISSARAVFSMAPSPPPSTHTILTHANTSPALCTGRDNHLGPAAAVETGPTRARTHTHLHASLYL